MIVVVDYQKGNIRSVARGLEAAGAAVAVSQDADAIARADAVVLPGVGAFADAMGTLAELGQDEAIREAIGRGAPFLGICLGMHLMFAAGEEHAEGDAPTPGLGLIPGVVCRMPRTDAEGTPYKIPHVGWNAVNSVPTSGGGNAQSLRQSCSHGTSTGRSGSCGTRFVSTAPAAMGDAPQSLFDGIPSGEHFYFTHSYIAPESDATIATTTHSVTFPCAVRQGAAFGVQFHPEKSSDAGARLLANFVGFVRKA